MHNLAKRLEKKGWNKKDINKAVNIINKAKENKAQHTIFLEKRILWLLFFIIIVGNFSVSVALLPLLIALENKILYPIIAIMGIVFGFVFEIVIRSMEHLERGHHAFLALLMPLAAAAGAFIISKVSNETALKLGMQNIHSPFVTALVYAFAFASPYLVCRFVMKMEYYSRE